jgi:hypothetical protein
VSVNPASFGAAGGGAEESVAVTGTSPVRTETT